MPQILSSRETSTTSAGVHLGSAGALSWALSQMHPDLRTAGLLPGESFADAKARRAAAADILGDYLDEYAELAAGEVAA